MEGRLGPRRPVNDPIVRQVGFVTSKDKEVSATNATGGAKLETAGSITAENRTKSGLAQIVSAAVSSTAEVQTPQQQQKTSAPILVPAVSKAGGHHPVAAAVGSDSNSGGGVDRFSLASSDVGPSLASSAITDTITVITGGMEGDEDPAMAAAAVLHASVSVTASTGGGPAAAAAAVAAAAVPVGPTIGESAFPTSLPVPPVKVVAVAPSTMAEGRGGETKQMLDSALGAAAVGPAGEKTNSLGGEGKKTKVEPNNPDVPEKAPKPTTRAERRALQEAQRAAKAANKETAAAGEGGGGAGKGGGKKDGKSAQPQPAKSEKQQAGGERKAKASAAAAGSVVSAGNALAGMSPSSSSTSLMVAVVGSLDAKEKRGKEERQAGGGGAAAKAGGAGGAAAAAAAVATTTTAAAGTGAAAGGGGAAAATGAASMQLQTPKPQLQFDDEARVAKARRRQFVEQTEVKNRVELFRHLPQFVHTAQLPALENVFFSSDASRPHPAVYQVGLQYLTGDVVGGNARCVAMLQALREMLVDYTVPAERSFARDLTAQIKAQVSFLITCRPLSIGMGNAIRHLKHRIARITATMSAEEAKATVIADIDQFIHEKVVLAGQEVVQYAVQKIRQEGEVLLVYGCSHVVESVLLEAHNIGRQFRVIVVDARPQLEGREMLRRLVTAGISCTYAHINSVCYLMPEATRVLLGAAGVLANGTVCARIGTACVAMAAHAQRVPVLICCETFKFHERVQIDSITSNELGDPDALLRRDDTNVLKGWADEKHLQLLNLMYDVTPAEYISMIITELGMVPATSVPAILREYRKDPLVF
eukprot:TRINITY_DN7085_c0_g1_i2.p1 TRINITY_DN7085_c0_g1~~TRINITY_DN7085_c0_g1_i2.p1  ORF type:complete len:837 (+),score=273.79 TRINITY_DN7085_c0_g1_i2:62-2512(+)